MLTLFLSLLVSTVVGVWPEPGHFEQQQDPLRVSANFTIQLESETAPRTIAADLAEAIATTISQIQRDSLAPLTAVPTGALYTKLETKKPSQQLRLLSIHLLQEHAHQNTLCPDQQQQPIYAKEHFLCHHPFTNSNYLQTSDHEHSIHNKPSIVAEMQLPLKERVEAYEIHIQSTDGHPTAVLSASSALGVLRGLQTFTQLVYTLKPTHKKTASSQDKAAQPDPLQQSIRFIHGPVHIKDQPAFPYRGLLLDTSRNFYSIASIKHTLRAMSWVKLNVLHWHIVDSQSWPIHIPSHPQLSQMGAYSDEETYSVQEIMDLTRFANSHGIEILLEIDSPGHTAIIGEAFPDLVACKNKAPWSNYAAEPPAGQLRLADDRALSLINEVFGFLTTHIPGTLFSSGGDEVNKKCYEEDEPTQTSLRAKNQSLSQAITSFVLATHDTIRRSGKVPVVWEEMVLDEAVPLPTDNTLVTVWRNSSMVSRVVQKGYSIIHGASDYSYLDCGLGGWLGNSINGTSWCDPYKTWQKIYSFDPYKNVAPAQRKQVLGGQALLWSEQTDEQNMDGIIWPRALSTAELYWTGTERARSVTEALPRIHDMRYRFVQRGVRAAPLQPHWCAIRPGQCDLPPSATEN